MGYVVWKMREAHLPHHIPHCYARRSRASTRQESEDAKNRVQLQPVSNSSTAPALSACNTRSTSARAWVVVVLRTTCLTALNEERSMLSSLMPSPKRKAVA